MIAKKMASGWAWPVGVGWSLRNSPCLTSPQACWAREAYRWTVKGGEAISYLSLLIADELVALGVPPTDIVLGFVPEQARAASGFGVG